MITYIDCDTNPYVKRNFFHKKCESIHQTLWPYRYKTNQIIYDYRKLEYLRPPENTELHNAPIIDMCVLPFYLVSVSDTGARCWGLAKWLQLFAYQNHIVTFIFSFFLVVSLRVSLRLSFRDDPTSLRPKGIRLPRHLRLISVKVGCSNGWYSCDLRYTMVSCFEYTPIIVMYCGRIKVQ